MATKTKTAVFDGLLRFGLQLSRSKAAVYIKLALLQGELTVIKGAMQEKDRVLFANICFDFWTRFSYNKSEQMYAKKMRLL